jgi:eukaryotic-like serine/threonine-protein kinase
MAALPPEDLLPVLVADLADDEAHEVLEAAAFTGSQVYVPLDAAPVNASLHVLEVHLPSMAEPVLFLALPLGPPTDDGFPLRIQPMPDSRPSPTTGASGAVPRGVVRSRRATTSMALSASHTADLSQVGPLPTEPPDSGVLGRALAGGKLLMETLIGRGGVGAVYKARHRELRMAVAVKVLHESFQHDIDFCRRFYAEALAASRLDHPNITRVIDFGQEPDGLLYLAMEFLAGVELRAVLDKEGPLPAQRIAEFMMQTCAGLSHAHARGIVHRDIKPENLVVVPGQDDDGQPIELVKVCDFGIAVHRALASTEEVGVIAGTPEYMSPEQCRGDELDARSDVYSCGVVLYELATGQVPFTAERPQSILNKHQFTAPMSPSVVRPGVDPTLERIILRALAKEPEDRPQSMRELRAELRELLAPADSGVPASSRQGLGRSMGTSEEMRPLAPAPTPARPPPLPARAAAPPTVPRAPASQPDASPAWLERGPVYAPSASAYGSGAPDGALSVTPQAGAVVADDIADALVKNAAAWLQQFARTTDHRAFAHLAQRLEPALRTLAAAGETRAMWAVSSTLHGIAMEGTQAVGSRAHVAATLLRIFDDPAVLSSVAEQLLRGSEEARDHAKRLLVHAGVAGAYGLYGARVKLANDQAIRGIFTTVLKDFGPKAWPVVRAALEKIIASEQAQNPRAMELAEDLLLSVPLVGDESSGHLVVKYLRVNVSGVCRAATASIVKMWGDRARPLLVGMLQSKDDAVRIAGIAGLRQLDGIDEHVVPRLQAILQRRIAAGEELRAAAALALSHTVASARPPAISLLAQLLTPQRDAPPDPRIATPTNVLSREDAVVLAVGRSLMTIGGKNYRGLVAERAERSPEPLRTQLKKLLGS